MIRPEAFAGGVVIRGDLRKSYSDHSDDIVGTDRVPERFVRRAVSCPRAVPASQCRKRDSEPVSVGGTRGQVSSPSSAPAVTVNGANRYPRSAELPRQGPLVHAELSGTRASDAPCSSRAVARATDSSVILRTTRCRAMPAWSRWRMTVFLLTSYRQASASIEATCGYRWISCSICAVDSRRCTGFESRPFLPDGPIPAVRMGVSGPSTSSALVEARYNTLQGLVHTSVDHPTQLGSDCIAMRLLRIVATSTGGALGAGERRALGIQLRQPIHGATEGGANAVLSDAIWPSRPQRKRRSRTMWVLVRRVIPVDYEVSPTVRNLLTR